MQVEVVNNLSFPKDLFHVFNEPDKFLGVFECKEYRLKR